MPRRTVPQRLGVLGVLAVVAGLLVAGLAMPVVAGVSWAAHRSSSALDALPSYLQQPPLAQRSVLYAADGKTVLATIAGSEDRVVVSADQIPDVVKKAIVAIEDNRFYEHNGVDVRSIFRAIKINSSSGDYAQGASTITQQYVKLVELEQAVSTGDKQAQKAATQKSISRKIDDARLAIALEKTMTKDQILTNYLNIAYFGEGVYGIGTAAEHYFGVDVSQLSLAQAALLAGLVNSPSAYDPVAHPDASKQRRDDVLAAVERYQFLPDPQVQAALKEPVVVHPQTKTVDPCESSPAPNYCAYVVEQLKDDPKIGSDKLFTGGLRVVTGWDPRIQTAAQATVSAHVPNDQRQVVASVVEQPGTGVIAAIAQNRGYGTGPAQTKNVYAALPSYDVGSTFKAMTLTAAVEQNVPLTTTLYSPACLTLPNVDNPVNPKNRGCPRGFQNAGDSEAGNFDLYSGTWDSVNTFYVQLEQKVGGPAAVAAIAKRLGVVGSTAFQGGSYGPSLTLGAGGGFSVVDMANAYATLDAHGQECTPTAVTKVTDPTGAEIAFTHTPCREGVSASTADTVTSVLQGVLTKPGATGAGLGIGRPAAGKTGTLDDGIGGWFVGYVPQYVTAVGVFDPRGPNYAAAPICDNVTGRCFTQNTFFGASIAGPVWQGIMKQTTQGLPSQDFAQPQANDTGADATPTQGPLTTVPGVTGQPAGAAAAALQAAGFVVRYQTVEVDSAQPKDTVVSTDPGGGSQAPQGSTVVMILSNGQGAGGGNTVTVTPTNSLPPGVTTPPAGPGPGPAGTAGRGKKR